MPQIDVRNIPPPERHPAIFRAFDALAPGDALVLVNDHYPKPLLYTFQAERSRHFEWTLLEAGPQTYRVAITRRQESQPRGVSQYLGWDHDRLDQHLELVVKLAEGGKYAEGAARFQEFTTGLTHHIEMEEAVLFPAFEGMTGMTEGPTRVMRMEHVEIRRLLAAMTRALGEEDAAGFQAGLRDFKEVIGSHNMKEENILYPSIDQGCGTDTERDQLVKRMQAV